MLLEIADLSRSTYYYHMHPDRQRHAARQTARREAIEAAVLAEFDAARSRYGYRRIHEELQKAGWKIAAKSVRGAMRDMGCVCPVRRKRRHTVQQGNAGKRAPNHLRRQWATSAPNQKWVTDITEFHLHGRVFYLAAIMDLFDRQIISYTLGSSPTVAFMNATLNAAIETQHPGDTLLVHSDQGFQFQHASWQDRLVAIGATQSMSRKGNCYDNAIIENFFGHLKEELVNHTVFPDAETFVTELHAYMAWYNTKRISLSLNGFSPVDYRSRMLAGKMISMHA